MSATLPPVTRTPWQALWVALVDARATGQELVGWTCPQCRGKIRGVNIDRDYGEVRYGDLGSNQVRSHLVSEQVTLRPCGHQVPPQVVHPVPEPSPIYDALVAERVAGWEQAKVDEAFALVEPLLEARCLLLYQRTYAPASIEFGALAEAIVSAAWMVEAGEGVPTSFTVFGPPLVSLPWDAVGPAAARIESEWDWSPGSTTTGR